MKRVVLALVTAVLPSVAQEVREPNPLIVEIHLDRPLSGLKDTVGEKTGSGVDLGYVFNAKSSTFSRTLAISLCTDDYVNGGTHREAHGVGIGPEYTIYFRPGFTGPYVSVKASLYAWSLTSREDGKLHNEQYLRTATALAVGYRFGGRWSIEVHWKTANLDQDLAMNALGIGIRRHF